MGLQDAGSILMSVGGTTQTKSTTNTGNTKDKKQPSGDKSFEDTIKNEIQKKDAPKNQDKKTQADKPKDEPVDTEQKPSDSEVEVSEKVAVVLQNPMLLQMLQTDMIVPFLQSENDAVKTTEILGQNLPDEMISLTDAKQMFTDGLLKGQTKVSDEQPMQFVTPQKVDMEQIKNLKQNDATLQMLKTNVQTQNPLENVDNVKNEILQQTAIAQKQTKPVENLLTNAEVVTEQNAPELEEVKKPISEMMLQTKQKTAEGEIVHVKVADVLPVTKENVAEQLANRILMRNSNEFELQLNPEALGKIQIKVHFDKGETHVSILCESAKALQLLSENSHSLAMLLENRTGNQTNIQMHENKDAFYKQETDQNGHQQQQQTKDEQQQRQQKQKHHDAMDFLQQMRLGLV